MKKKICSFLFPAAMALLVAVSTGCRSKPSADMVGSGDTNMLGDPLMGDVPLSGDNLGLPTDGNRNLFDPVYFAYDSSQVQPGEAGKVEAVAKYLKKGKGKGVIVEGHTDERGSREYNMALGERRALAVRDYLISLGVDPAIIQTKSYGEEDPAALGHDENAWRLNRRSVFAIY